MREITNAIGGRRVWTKSGRSQPVYNPATGEEVALVPLSSAEEVGEAIAAAKAAVAAIPVPFDQAIQDDAAGRPAIQATMTALTRLTATTVEVADALGLTLNLE